MARETEMEDWEQDYRPAWNVVGLHNATMHLCVGESCSACSITLGHLHSYPKPVCILMCMCKKSYRFFIPKPSIFARVHKNGWLEYSSHPFLCTLDLCTHYTVRHQSREDLAGTKAPPHTPIHELAEELLLLVSHRQYSTIILIDLVSIQM